MSRVGKYPVVVPSGVTVTLAGTEVSVKGKLGVSTLSWWTTSRPPWRTTRCG